MRANNKVEIRFPSGHPVWSYPAGQRPAKVRQLVDTALRVDEFLNEIRSLVTDMDSRLKRIDDFLSGVNVQNKKELTAPGPRQANIDNFDVDAFMKL